MEIIGKSGSRLPCKYFAYRYGMNPNGSGNRKLYVSAIAKKIILIFFGIFAYEFEPLHNRSFLVKSFAYAHGEIIYSVNCEI